MGDFLLVIIELFSLGAFVLSQFTRLTDRQTDGQMLIGKTALHTMQGGKKDIKVCIGKAATVFEKKVEKIWQNNKIIYTSKVRSVQVKIQLHT